MSIYQLKSSFQNLLRPTVNFLAARHVSANMVTILTMALSIFLGFALVMYALLIEPETGSRLLWLLLPLWLFIRMALNAIDGMLAREHDQKTTLGAILNEAGDIVSDVALTLPFFVMAWNLNDYSAAVMLGMTMILAILTEYIGVLGPMLGASRRYDGPLGKSDRAFVFGALALVYALGWISLGSAILTWVFSACAALSLWTCLKRAHAILSEVTHA